MRWPATSHFIITHLVVQYLATIHLFSASSTRSSIAIADRPFRHAAQKRRAKRLSMKVRLRKFFPLFSPLRHTRGAPLQQLSWFFHDAVRVASAAHAYWTTTPIIK